MAPASRVTLGVPGYRGEAFMSETLSSIQRQTHRDFQVVISLDGPQPTLAAICEPFLQDPRFRLVTQPERLGWVGNLNWLIERVETDFWCYQQQDDLLEPTYLETLVDAAQRAPAAAVVYCDIQAFGALDQVITQSSVCGSPPARQLALLCDHHSAVAFRGLTRVEALRRAGRIRPNDVDSFSCDTVWMSSLARCGELHRVPLLLYRKRYHEAGEHRRWGRWPPAQRRQAWLVHCADMLQEALLVDASLHERRLLWLAAVERLVISRTAPGYLPDEYCTAAGRAALLADFCVYLRTHGSQELPQLLAAQWPALESWTREFLGGLPPRSARATSWLGRKLARLLRRKPNELR